MRVGQARAVRPHERSEHDQQVGQTGEAAEGVAQASSAVTGGLVNQVRRNPLMRACRPDKLTYAALDRTLVEYQNGCFQEALPVWQLLSAPPSEIRRRAEQLAPSIEAALARRETRAPLKDEEIPVVPASRPKTQSAG